MPIEYSFDDLDLREDSPLDASEGTVAGSKYACSGTCDSVYQCCA
ncbi:MAG: hypothetical protein QOI11_1210 [Candidatus Eremiobacteraeota bacterium]|jgi:hypothetical protein|nr:hypothetical protein [Candidatus Eremiobacteraeota bacterium]